MLYVVPTPIGNLEDLTFRALKVLQQVEGILAEDTRHTLKLLNHYDVHKPLMSYHDHSGPVRVQEIITRLQQGQNLALVSDAGMPGISDPGYELIQACWQARIQVEVLPGANALLTALVASGLDTGRFTFEGFLAPRGQERQRHLALLSTETRTLIFYEAPHHLQQTLQDLEHWLGKERVLFVGRELTKLHQELWRGTLAEARQHFQSPRGEFTLVLQGAPEQAETLTEGELITMLQTLIAKGLPPSSAARTLAVQTGLPRKQLYQLVLDLQPMHPET